MNELPSQFQPIVEQPQPVTPKNNFFTSSLILLLLLVATMGGLWFYTTTQSEESAQPAVEAPTASPIITQEASKPLLFVRDWSLWKSEKGVETQLSAAGQAVLAFEMSPDTQKIAYTWGELQTNSSEYQYVYPHTLTVLDTTIGTETVIHHEEVYTNMEYVQRIVDVAFSHDGEYLVYSTSNTVYLHNFEANSTIQLFDQTDNKQAKTMKEIPIFGYSGMSFSPTDEYVLLRRGFYEGVEPVVVAVGSNTEVTVPLAEELGGYGGYVLDWYDDHSLVATKDVYPRSEQAAAELLKLDITNQSIEKMADVPGNYILYGAYQLGKLRLFAAINSDPGAESNEVKWLEIDQQQVTGLKQVASFQKPSNSSLEEFVMASDTAVIYQINPWGKDRSEIEIYLYDILTQQTQKLQSAGRLSRWK